jgi:hypothetical protein
MPIRVSASTELGFVLVVFEGVVTLEEFEQYVAPLTEQPSYALMKLTLIDMSAAAKGDTPSETVRLQARRAAENVDARIDAGSKMALVATNPEFFGLSRMYQTLRSDSPVEIEIFRSKPEAEAWLELPEDYTSQLVEVLP